jgi:hypothetical protein
MTLFYATKNDLLPVLSSIEKNFEIRYIQTGLVDQNMPIIYNDSGSINDLGIASYESAIRCTRYLIFPKYENVKISELPGQRKVIDQMLNPNTVEFSPGGIWQDDILLYGRFASASNSSFSISLMKLLHFNIKKNYTKIRAYYVGPEAEKMLDAGKRLTIAAQSPSTFDLRRI